MSETSPLVFRTAVLSLGAQVLIGLVTLSSLFIPMSDADRMDLVPIVTLESISQAIEFLYYAVSVCYFRSISTKTRYLDWVFSTPVMLVSTALFFYHRQGLPYADLFMGDSWTFYGCLGFNWLMLAFGYLAEANIIPRWAGLSLGGASFVASFTLLAMTIMSNDLMSIVLFFAIYFVWALYGVAAAFGEVPKNISYNALDVVSKNFYGIFLFVYVFTRQP